MVDKKRTVSRSAFLVSLGGLISLIAGLGSQIVIAMLFGAGMEVDAYLTALAIPVYLQAVLLSGLSFVFIPAFIDARSTGKEGEAWSIVGTFFWVVGGTLIIIAAIIWLFSSTLISISAPGLSREKADLATRMLRVVVITIPLSGYAVLTSGIQNARNRFFWPAAAGAAASLGMLLVLWLLHGALGPMALAWGFFLGVLLQASMTTLPVIRHGWHGVLPLGDERVRKMIRLMAPLILFGLLTRAIPILERYFASGLADGALSYLGYASKTTRIFQTLLVASIGTAIFPVMSRAYTESGDAGLGETLHHGMRLTLAVGLPLLAIMTAVAVPFVQVLLERGAFQHETTLHVARILPVILAGTVLMPMVGNLLSRTFYVKKNTLIVPITAAAAMFVYIGLAILLVGKWGYVGLAVAQMVFAIAGVISLALVLIYKFKAFRVTTILKPLVTYGAASLGAFVIAFLLTRLFGQLPSWLQLGIAVPVSAVVYLFILSQIDLKITKDILELIGIHQFVRITRKLRSLTRARTSPVK